MQQALQTIAREPHRVGCRRAAAVVVVVVERTGTFADDDWMHDAFREAIRPKAGASVPPAH